jgi:hypothetical protein
LSGKEDSLSGKSTSVKDDIPYASPRDLLTSDIGLSISEKSVDCFEDLSDSSPRSYNSSSKSIRGGRKNMDVDMKSIRGGRKNSDEIAFKKLMEASSSQDDHSGGGLPVSYSALSLDRRLSLDSRDGRSLSPANYSSHSFKGNEYKSASDYIINNPQSEDIHTLEVPTNTSTSSPKNSPRGGESDFVQKKWNVKKNTGIMEKGGKSNVKKQKKNIYVPIAAATEEERQFYALKVSCYICIYIHICI